MQYYASDDKNKTGKVWAAAMTLLTCVVCLVLMLVIRFGLPVQPAEGEGIMINFGDVEQAGGEHDTAMTDDMAAVPSQPHSDPAPTAPTNNHGDVEVPRRQQRPTARTQPAEPVRTADPRALFPGRTAGSTSTSEGTSTGAGNQGDPAGTADGGHDGTGTGTSGTSFSLSGRSPVGALPKPDYNSRREGRVVVEITVDPAGRVTAADYRATGSAGVDNVMIDDALRAARKARFNHIEGDGLQAGTITYVFRMN